MSSWPDKRTCPESSAELYSVVIFWFAGCIVCCVLSRCWSCAKQCVISRSRSKGDSCVEVRQPQTWGWSWSTLTPVGPICHIQIWLGVKEENQKLVQFSFRTNTFIWKLKKWWLPPSALKPKLIWFFAFLSKKKSQIHLSITPAVCCVVDCEHHEYFAYSPAVPKNLSKTRGLCETLKTRLCTFNPFFSC